MKLRIFDRWRATLGQKYLDFAEKHPRFGGRAFARLRRIRKSQRQWSERAYTKSRPPEGIEIELLCFRLIEIFHIEDLDRLMGGIFRLFPDLEDDVLRQEPFAVEFRRSAESIFGGAWWNVGRIFRDKKTGLFGPEAVIKQLPKEVKHIDVEIHKILPSLFIVVLDVHLTDKATEQLTQLQDRHYLSEIRFKRLVPLGKFEGGHSRSNPGAMMKKEILDWLKGLRGEVETCIRPFVNGHFMQGSPDKEARLPAIEVYALKGVPTGTKISSTPKSGKESEVGCLKMLLAKLGCVLQWSSSKRTAEQNEVQRTEIETETSIEALNSWFDETRWWWDSLGFDLHGFNTYTDGKIIFVPGESRKISSRPYRLTDRFLVLWEPYLKTIELKMFGGDERAAIAHNTRYMLNTVLPSIALLELIEFSQKAFEKLRQEVFGSMRRRWLSTVRLSKYIKLNDAILHTSMLLDRISKEFEQQMPRFRRENKEIEELKRMESSSQEKSEALGEVLLDSVRFRIDFLGEHVLLVQNWLLQYLTLRNTAASFFLAVIAGIAAVISVILAALALLPSRWLETVLLVIP